MLFPMVLLVAEIAPHIRIYIIMISGDCLWLELPFIVQVTGYLRSIFPTVGYAFTTVPSYPSGQIGFFIASRSEVQVYR